MGAEVKARGFQTDPLPNFAGLLASSMVCLYEGNRYLPITNYHVALTEKGQAFVSAWKSGEQRAAVAAAGAEATAVILPFDTGQTVLHWGSRSPHADGPSGPGGQHQNSIPGPKIDPQAL